MRKVFNHTWRCLVVVMMLVLSFQAEIALSQESPSKGEGPKFLRVGVAVVEKGESSLLMGQLRENGIVIWDADGVPRFFTLEEADEVAKKQETPIANGKTVPTLPKKITIDRAMPSVQFEMTHERTTQCTALREFQTFLKQTNWMAKELEGFEINVSGEKYKACGLRIQGALESRGIKARVYLGKLPYGGVVVRGFLKGTKKIEAAPVEVEPTPEPQMPAERGQPILERELFVTIQGYEQQLYPGNSNFFVRSFKSSELKGKISVRYRLGKQEVSVNLLKLPKYKVGEFDTKWETVPTGMIADLSYDQIEVTEIPPEILYRAAAEQLAYEHQYNFSAFLTPSYLVIEGSGFQRGHEINPVILGAEYRASKRLILGLHLVPPVAVAKSAPTLFLGKLAVDYTLLNDEAPPIERGKRFFRAGLGLGAFFYSATQNPETKTVGKGLLTDFVGVFGEVFIKHEFTPHVILSERVWLSPLPSTAVTNFSLSSGFAVEPGYCFAVNQCIVGKVDYSRYFIDYKDYGQYSATVRTYSLGYQRFF